LDCDVAVCLSYWTFTSFYSLAATATVCFYACRFTRFFYCNSCFCLSVCHYYCIWAKLPDSNKCVYVCDVCLDAPRVKVALVPCGHATCCQQCMDTLVVTISHCPVCRGVVSSAVRFCN